MALIISVYFLFPFQGPVLSSIKVDWHLFRLWCETFMILYEHLPSRLILTLLRSLTVMCTLHILILLLRQLCSRLLLLAFLKRTLNRVWRSNVADNTGIYQPLLCCSGLCGTLHRLHELHRSQSCLSQPSSIFPLSTFYRLHVWHSAMCLIERSCRIHQSCTSSLHRVQCRTCYLPLLISCSRMKRIAKNKTVWCDISARIAWQERQITISDRPPMMTSWWRMDVTMGDWCTLPPPWPAQKNLSLAPLPHPGYVHLLPPPWAIQWHVLPCRWDKRGYVKAWESVDILFGQCGKWCWCHMPLS